MGDDRILAFDLGDLNPLNWLGSAASFAVGDVWKSAMTALWSAGLWLLGLAFKLIDAFTTPDLSTSGPLARVLPYTFAIGAFLAVLLGLVQIGVAAWQRNGQSIARVLVGTVQFWGVWVGYCAVAALLVAAASGLTRGLLSALLHVQAFSEVPATASWPTRIDDTVVATVLGVLTLFIIVPAAIGYVLLMLVREAALLILAATSPIAAAGLLAETTRVWFWKSLRWFIATVMMAPLAALVLGIGIQICEGIIEAPAAPACGSDCSIEQLNQWTQAHQGFQAASVGMAVTGALVILIGAICPLLLFRLLAFVDPGTPSGAAMRSSLAATGGLTGLLSGRGGAAAAGGESTGSGAASRQDDSGRSSGEATANTQTAARFSGMLGSAGQIMGTGMVAAGAVTAKAASVGSDVLGGAGVGHPAYYDNHDGAGPEGADPPREPAGASLPTPEPLPNAQGPAASVFEAASGTKSGAVGGAGGAPGVTGTETAGAGAAGSVAAEVPIVPV